MRIMRNLSMNERIYHPAHLWEDAQNGLFKLTPTPQDQDGIKMIAASRELLSSPDALHDAMMHVAFEWRFSAEVNLSNRSMNRQAWLGQAACCFECGANEDLVKAAWRTLSSDEMEAANGVADMVIAQWENERKVVERGQDLFG